MTKLTAQAVHALMTGCLFRDGEPTDAAIKVEGIMTGYRFHPDRILQHTMDIAALLAELPEGFQADKGGGWTFLNACDDRHGEQWTGEHHDMESLFCLGIAAGLAKWMMPRDMWSVFPGGMPYVQVLSPKTPD